MPVRINGSTSGYVELAAPAVAGSVVMTLPATTGTVAVQGEAYGRSATATVATDQTTTSSSYTDLATAGPAVTITTGTKALVIVTNRMRTNLSAYNSYMGFAVSGASSVAASDDSAYWITGPTTIRASMVVLQTGLTAGSNIFTAKYKAESGSTAGFEKRTITVIDMGS